MGKSFTLMLSALMVAVLLLSGCGNAKGGSSSSKSAASSQASSGQTSSGGKSSSSGSKSSQSGTSRKKIKLSLFDYWVKSSNEADTVVGRELIAQYQKDHPNVELSEEILDNTSYKTKIQTLAAGNDLPDVFLSMGATADMLYNHHLIQPLDNALNSNPTWKKGFKAGAFKNFTASDGKILGAPFSTKSTSVIFYNQAIFNKAGITQFPKTWDAFITDIQKIKSKGYTPIALGNKGKWVAESCILSTLGDRFTGTKWFESIQNKKGAKFTDPKFVAALAALQQLAKIGAFNSNLNSIDNNQQRTLYYNGKAAMFIEGAWAVGAVTKDAPKDILKNTRTAVIPAVKGGNGDPNSFSGGAGWAYELNANLKGDKLKAAVDLIKLLTGVKEANKVVVKGTVPATTPTNYDKSKLSPLFKDYLNTASNMKFTPVYDVVLSPDIIDTMNTGLQKLLLNDETPKQLAQAIQKTYSGS